ncbi:hypothetical protein VitviT2T_014975 [Vitis vinifera]|uniref:LysM domain-containing protein n=1 Tax=Vitis vinifera TaxID=29760 RepID=A0ABY9CQE2_VITVI|nr:hypothetical protein VitviT2T_014975 [Vitis vinifera]
MAESRFLGVQRQSGFKISVIPVRLGRVVSASTMAVATTAKATPECDTVVGVESGDTCFDIADKFQLTTEFFDSINPNLNCDALFVGQWVCVDGTAN